VSEVTGTMRPAGESPQPPLFLMMCMDCAQAALQLTAAHAILSFQHDQFIDTMHQNSVRRRSRQRRVSGPKVLGIASRIPYP
jgi:hypothetical protein